MQVPSRVLQQVTTWAQRQAEVFEDAFSSSFTYKEPFHIIF